MAITVTINGEPATLQESCSVRQLLEQRGLDQLPCAVEVNRQLVPKRQHEQQCLSAGDQIEIVTLVGGG